MKLNELVDLISIRQYVVNATGNSSIDRATVNYMNGALLMIDKKIVSLLQSDEFREYIDYKDVRQAIKNVADLNNIKSGLQKNPHSGQWEKISK
jgi:hypothetical protein